MTIGRKRRRAASMAESSIDFALLALLRRELDDQDGVLGRQADQGDEADLEVDVVRHAAQPDRDERADEGERHREQHRDRQRPALVLRGEDQEHEDHAEEQHLGRGAAGLLLLEGRAGPGDAELGRQLALGDLLDRGDAPRPSFGPCAGAPSSLIDG